MSLWKHHSGHGVSNRLRIIAASCVLATLAPAIVHGAPVSKRPQDEIASTVASLLTKAFPTETCKAGTRLSLGLWMFDEDKVPVGPATAERIYQETVSRLLELRPKCIDVLDSAGLAAVANHLSKSGALEKNGGSILASLTEANQDVTIVVFPSLFNQGGRTVFSLRAADRATGRTIALTAPTPLQDKILAENVSDTALSMDATIRAAGKYFAQNAVGMKAVRPLGIFFEDTGAQPEAGRYMLDKLMAHLSQETVNPVTGKTLKIRGIAVEPKATVGSVVEATTLKDSSATDAEERVHDLSGRLWLRDDVVELRLSMADSGGGTLSWQGRMKVSEFKDLELRPKNPALAARPLETSSFAFQLTSPRGRNPIYRPGEELVLLARLGKDAWVYCFYIDTNGMITTVLPNRFRDESNNFNRLAAKILHQLPDPARDRFRFTLTADTMGEELMTCFASTNEIRAQLPKELFASGMSPIPFLRLEQLRSIFGSLKDTAVSEASVTVTVAQ
jgi:hypothetical protein